MRKNFKGGLSSLLGENALEVKYKEITKTSQEGTYNDETRATFIVNIELLEKFKAIAYWERNLIKNVINEALLDYVKKYEDKNGAIKPILKK